ncbi:MAG: C40 family peptidase [Bacteroidota bacterium]|nr:C40 family peptidase [Bacteroidota bacterium]
MDLRAVDASYRRVLIPTVPFLLAASLIGCSSSSRTSDVTERAGALTSLRRTVLAKARSYIGTPYSPGGTTRGGMDCSGFVSTVYLSAGINLPRTAAAMYTVGKPVPRGKIKPGDLVFFRDTAGPGITHVAIALDAESFIHSSTTLGVIVSRFDETYYARRFAGARNILGP